jgi:hypothetical protein
MPVAIVSGSGGLIGSQSVDLQYGIDEVLEEIYAANVEQWVR